MVWATADKHLVCNRYAAETGRSETVRRMVLQGFR